ncbi:MAG: prephenate dehydrogenase/arogenate dehydrogenase family protein [Acidobacteriota bacterium]
MNDTLPQFNEDRPAPHVGPGARVGVIGGLGEMGRLFSRFFAEQGYRVSVADVDTELSGKEVVESSDIVLFAVPLHKTVEVMRGLIPFTRPEQLLMDLTSLKSPPVREMLRSDASVVGLHPMFGGRVSSFAGQTLVACPVRVDPDVWASLREIFIKGGMKVKEATAEEHDRMMSIIQVLFHMTTMLTGRVLRDLGVDIAETMEYTSPSYRLEMNLLGRIFAQNGALYSAITEMNPYTGEIIGQLRAGLDSYEKWYEAEDLDSFIRDFERSADHLGSFCRRAYGESSQILDFTVKLARGE